MIHILQQAKTLLIPRFHAGSFFRDWYFLLVIIFLQVAIIPPLLPSITTEFVTIWLCLYFVFLTPIRSLLLGIFAGLALETHQLIPASFYFFNYWIIGILIILVRNHISWRNYWPWLTTFVLASLWMNTSELFLIMVKSGTYGLSPWHQLLTVISRLVFTAVAGFMMVFWFIIGKIEEPSP